MRTHAPHVAIDALSRPVPAAQLLNAVPQCAASVSFQPVVRLPDNRVLLQLVQLVVFVVKTQRYAIPLASVRRVVLASEVTIITGAPPSVLGIIDVEGELVAVLDITARAGGPPRQVQVFDHFLIAQTPSRAIALLVDGVTGVIEVEPSAIRHPAPSPQRTDHFPGAIRLDDRLVLIHEVESFLSAQESQALAEALDEGA